MIISAIVAFDENNAIGAENKLLWHLPNDLKRFKSLTTSHTIIMGRKTFESIGKPLPNRNNIVITNNKSWQHEGIIVVNDWNKAIEIAKKSNEAEVFVIGGGQIYQQFFNQFDKIYVTIIKHQFKADTFFPLIHPIDWNIIEREEGIVDDKNKFKHTFITYSKK